MEERAEALRQRSILRGVSMPIYKPHKVIDVCGICGKPMRTSNNIYGIPPFQIYAHKKCIKRLV